MRLQDTKSAIRSALLVVAGVILLLVAGGCTRLLGEPEVQLVQTGSAPQPATKSVPAGTDPEDEVIGRREHPRIVATYGGIYSDRDAEIMVASITGKLLTAANRGNSKFTVTILDTPDVNAFALPGGYVYVTRGILALANDAGELAAVLAHEMAHVTLRHARARSNRTRTSEIVDRVITGVLGGNIETDQTAARSRLSLAAFSQAQELAADKEGVVIAGQAGYDPHAAARFLGAMGRFAALATAQEDSGDDFLSSHPSTPDRIQKAIESARSFGAPGIGTREREAYLTAIDGISFGDSPQQGAIVGQKFIHPELHFTFSVPKGYRLQNSQSAVVAVAGDGEALRFDSAEVPASQNLGDYLKSGWIAGLDPNSVRSERHGEIELATGRAKTDEWAFRVSVVRFEGEVYRFIFAAKSDSSRFAKAADDTVRSFRRAGEKDFAQIHRNMIALVTAKAGDTTSSLGAKMKGVEAPGDLFLVLNNLFTGDPIIVGQKYKIVVVE